MPATVIINDVPVPIDRLASFTFTPQSPDPADQGQSLLHIEDISGKIILVSGPDAVTLKVLLASIGIRDRSQPENAGASSHRQSSSAAGAGAPAPPQFPPGG